MSDILLHTSVDNPFNVEAIAELIGKFDVARCDPRFSNIYIVAGTSAKAVAAEKALRDNPRAPQWGVIFVNVDPSVVAFSRLGTTESARAFEPILRALFDTYNIVKVTDEEMRDIPPPQDGNWVPYLLAD
jgi:hypothetical protein